MLPVAEKWKNRKTLAGVTIKVRRQCHPSPLRMPCKQSTRGTHKLDLLCNQLISTHTHTHTSTQHTHAHTHTRARAHTHTHTHSPLNRRTQSSHTPCNQQTHILLATHIVTNQQIPLRPFCHQRTLSLIYPLRIFDVHITFGVCIDVCICIYIYLCICMRAISDI